MVDLYSDMTEALAERAAIDVEIDRLIASRSDVEARIKQLAGALVNGSNVQNGRHEDDSPMDPIEPIEDDGADEDAKRVKVGHLPPRKLELLRLLRDERDGDYGHLAICMYGEDTRTNRMNISAYFSMLKSAGYVEPTGQATFKLTAKGVAILGR